MTHTLHRYGEAESLQNDYVVFAIAAQTVNAKGIHPEFKVFEEIVRKYNPVNYGDMKTGNQFGVGIPAIQEGYRDNSIVHAVFTDEDTVADVLSELTKANLNVSIVVSGLLEQTAECCHKACAEPHTDECGGEAGIKPHTVEYSMGIWGKKELLPEDDVLKITTMCGHGMIAFSSVEYMVERIAKGLITPEKAAEKLASACHCGVFNPARAAIILKAMADRK